MVSISLIIFFSLVLFVYWFRYSCVLILQAREKEAYIAQTADANGLTFPAVQESLKRSATAERLDKLHRDLLNDYRILSFLLRCSSEIGIDPIEQRMLMLDYRLMQACYRVTRRTAPPQARKALEEMSNILSYFAHSVARRAVRSEA